MENPLLKEILYKILGSYSLLLTIIGTLSNILVFFICMRDRLWRTTTFKFLGIMALNDIVSLYEWNLKHFIDPFFGVDFNFTSLVWCRLSIFLQYLSLQYSAWILVSIAVDRLFSIMFQKWRKVYFTGRIPLIYIISLCVFLGSINFHVLFTNGYSTWANGTENITCYAQPDNDYTLFYIFGQVHLYLYSIIPFVMLTVINLLLVYIAVFLHSNNSIKSKQNDKAFRKKLNMTKTVLTFNFSFIVLTLPSAIVSGFYFITLLNTYYGILIITLCDNISFSFHSFNVLTLYFSNKRFKKELKYIVFVLFKCKTRVEKMSQSINTWNLT